VHKKKGGLLKMKQIFLLATCCSLALSGVEGLLATLSKVEAADTTIKGTGTTSATASLEVQNSAGTSIAYFRNDGNVGIGTTAPGDTLDIHSTADHRLTIRKSGASSVGLHAGGSPALVFKNNADLLFGIRTTDTGMTGWTERMRLTSAGNVGIGTTAPPGKLAIYDSTAGTYGLSIQSASGNRWWLASNTDGIWFNVGGGMTGGERLYVTPAGNVGIGTTRPNSLLNVNGNALFGGTSAGSIGNVQITTGGASPISNRLTYGTDGTGWKFAIGKNQGGTVTEQLTIQDNGNVGIGTTSPTQRLFVYGNIQKTGWVSFVQDHPTDPTKEIVYVSLEGGEVGTYVRGQAQLSNGQAEIQLPEHFSLVTAKDSGLTVQITPIDECQGLRAAELSNDRLIVKELNGGVSNARFYYLVNGLRDGYEGYNPIKQRL
jgi:hypothetical protein